MRLKGRLVREQMIKPAIEPILVDLLVAKLKKIPKCRAPIPVLGNVQLARGLTEPHRNE